VTGDIYVIGLIPAAGVGRRAMGLVKELLPISKDRLCIDCTIEQMKNVPVENILLVTSPLKAAYHMHVLGNERLGIPITYLCQRSPAGLGAAVLESEKIVSTEKSRICFMMPDTIVTPTDALKQLSLYKEPLVLGVHRVKNPEDFGVVVLDSRNEPVRIDDKPERPESNWVWSCAIFDPSLYDVLKKLSPSRGEIQLTEAFSHYLKEHREGTRVVKFESGDYIDVGNLSTYGGLGFGNSGAARQRT
jgi:glucose-1-phosphate thymidylyltransferase